MNTKDKLKAGDLVARTSADFRLKDSPPDRRFQFIPLKKVFGHVPEVIVIEKLRGKNNRLQVSALIPKKLIDEEEEEVKRKLEKLEEKSKKLKAQKKKIEQSKKEKK